uniref:Matrix metalloproteinase-17-like n=1 Tax=Stegastes partitus TaxID=144197 RepID=A0A3B5BCM9_9TELE
MKMWIVLLCLSSGRTGAASGDWLMRYGYLPPSDPSTGQLQAWTAVTDAVRAMQRFAGLRDTGVVDEETMALMTSPRCSLPDQEEASKAEGRKLRKRRAVSMWTRRNINWRLRSYPSSSHISRETVRSLVFYALRVWAEPTPLDFHEVGSPEAADLQVDFLHGYHGDGYPFDGAGGAVGHAFFPSDPARAGGVHLDAEEEWTFRQPASEGTDLFTVLVHEFGHALGLAHSSSRHSVMRPYYQGPAGDPLQYRLGAPDLEQITQLYGEPEETENPIEHISVSNCVSSPFRTSTDRCNTIFDAVAKIRGETFFFRGLTMWRVSSGGLVSGRGASVRRLWRSLPPDLPRLHAVLERQSDHAIIFISGKIQFYNKTLYFHVNEGDSRSSSLAGRDADEDEEAGTGRFGLVWDPEEGPVWGKIEPAEEEMQEDTWTRLLKEGVSGITTDTDGSVYLFRGDSYWKFMFPGSSPQDGYPRSSAADWLDCTDSTSPGVDDLSLSLSPSAGRQELRGRWAEEEEAGGRRKAKRKHMWTQCTCQNGADRRGVAAALLLLTCTRLAV